MARPYEELEGRTMTPELRRQAEELARKDMARYLVAEIHGDCGLSRDDLARILRVEPADLVQPDYPENEEEWELGPDEAYLVEVLNNLVTTLGGKLHVTAVFTEGEIRFTEPDAAAGKAAPTPKKTAAA